MHFQSLFEQLVFSAKNGAYTATCACTVENSIGRAGYHDCSPASAAAFSASSFRRSFSGNFT